MKRFVSPVAEYFYPVALPLLPFFGLMTASGGSGEGIFFAAALGIAYVLTGIALAVGLQRYEETIRFSIGSLLGVPLVVAGVASVFNAQDHFTLVGFFGQEFEFGSLGSFILIALTIALCTYATRNAASVFLMVFSVVAATVALCAILLWLGVSLLAPLATLGVGMSFFLCAAMLAAAALFDSRQPYWIAYGAISVVSFAGFILLFNSAAAFVGIGVGIAYVLYSFRSGEGLSLGTFPFATAAVGAVLLFSIVLGFDRPRIELPVDIRPSILATEYIIGPHYLGSPRAALLGTGPDSLSYAWNFYRPSQFNVGSWWEMTPDSAFSTAITLAIEIGILGLCSFLLLPATVLFRVVSARPHRSGISEVFYMLVLFAFGSAFFYSVDISLLLIGAAALGFSFSGESQLRPTGLSKAGVRRIIIYIAILLVCVGITLVSVASLQKRASDYAAQGQAALDENSADDASLLFDRAISLWPTASYVRGASISYARKLFRRLESGGALHSGPVAARAEADRAVMLAERATTIDARNYSLWLYKGSLYTSLIQFEYPDSKESARASLRRAELIAPKRPDVLYMMALLDVAVGDLQSARENVQKTLTLKPDYPDALKLLRNL